MRKRLIVLSTLAGCISMTAAGCTPGEQPSSASAEDESLNIAVIVNTLSSEYWGYVASGVNAYAADHPNVQVKVMGPPSESSYDEQLNMVETALSSQEYDGMVISALQAEAVARMISDADIPVAALNTPLESDKIASFVGTGNEAAAEAGGRAAVEAAKAAGWQDLSAIIIGGSQGDPAGEERIAGFRKGIAQAGGNELADEMQYVDWVADKAVTAMESIMSTHPEGVAIIAACNDDMAMAAASTAAGNPAYENTIFCGFDGGTAACESILTGELTMSVAQQPYDMGYTAVDACVRAIQGESLDAFIDTGCAVIDQSNAQARLDTMADYT